MRKKILCVLLAVMMVTGILSGCTKKETESEVLKAGTLSMLNASEEDYAKFQDSILGLIEDIEAGNSPKEQAQSQTEKTDGKKTEYVYYDDLNSMIMGLNTGEIQSVQLYSCVGRYLCANNTSFKCIDLYETATKEETKEVIENMFSDGFSFMLADSNTELRDELDKAIADMKEDGTLDKLCQVYIEDVITGKEPASVTMEKFDGADTIVFAVTGDLPPLDYISADGNPGGFNTAVLAEIGKRLGKNIELISIDSGARAIALSSGKADAAFWTRSNVEGLPPEDGETGPEGEDPIGKTDISEDVPELPPDFEESGMSQELDRYKKRDMPEGTIVTRPYYTDHYVMVTKN